MTHRFASLLFFPAVTLANRLSFSKKFLTVGFLVLNAACVVLYSLHVNLTQSVNRAQKELEGLALLKPLTKSVQLVQQHRGLSANALGSISNLEQMRIQRERDIDDVLSSPDALLLASVQSPTAWSEITAHWKRIEFDGMGWSRHDNFVSHNNLIDEMLRFETTITDHFELTSDPDLGLFYLIHTSTNDLLKTLEHLGQMRAYGTGILGEKRAPEPQKAILKALVVLLEGSLKPLRVSIEKIGQYNPQMQEELLPFYEATEKLSRDVIEKTRNEILNDRFAMSPEEFFFVATQAIDHGYAQMYQTIIPTAERLLQERIRTARVAENFAVGIALILLLLVAYFMTAVYYGTVSNIRKLSRSVMDFARGDMNDRIRLETRDELRQIEHSFNTMADEVVAKIKAQQSVLDILDQISVRVPGVVFQFRLRADGSSCIPYASEAIRDIYRVSPEDVRDDAARIFAVVHPDDLPQHLASIAASAKDLTPWHQEYRLKFEGEPDPWLFVNAIPQLENDGSVLWHGLITNITQRKRAEESLRITATVFESREGMIITDAVGTILRVNPAFTEITGYTADDAVGKKMSFLKSGRHNAKFYEVMWDSILDTGSWQGEIWNRRKSGEAYPEWLTITVVKDDAGNVSHYVGTLTDITVRKAAEDAMKHLAFYDPLTQLPNRRLLLDRLQLSLASSARNRSAGALLFIDLDNFKILNDTRGHDVGDFLLQEVAKRLATCVREGDTVARFGGDEFVVMLKDLSKDFHEATVQTRAVGEKILAALDQPYVLSGNRCDITSSIGATIFKGHNSCIDELLKQADMAMYQAKASGRNTLRFFNSES